MPRRRAAKNLMPKRRPSSCPVTRSLGEEDPESTGTACPAPSDEPVQDTLCPSSQSTLVSDARRFVLAAIFTYRPWPSPTKVALRCPLSSWKFPMRHEAQARGRAG
jgi:hypothetical protein